MGTLKARDIGIPMLMTFGGYVADYLTFGSSGYIFSPLSLFASVPTYYFLIDGDKEPSSPMSFPFSLFASVVIPSMTGQTITGIVDGIAYLDPNTEAHYMDGFGSVRASREDLIDAIATGQLLGVGIASGLVGAFLFDDTNSSSPPRGGGKWKSLPKGPDKFA